MQLLSELSNFFTAILTVYPQIPVSLHQQLKTMQAFLKSYDQKEFFLVQNFVRRLQTKAEKVKLINKRKRHEMKTQPFDEENKENVFSVINVNRHGNNFGSTSSLIGNKDDDNLIMKVLKDNDKRFQQYIMKQLSYQSSHDDRAFINITQKPKQPTPTLQPNHVTKAQCKPPSQSSNSSSMQQSLIHQLEFSKYHNQYQNDVTSSLSQIQQAFKEIKIDRFQGEDEVSGGARQNAKIGAMRKNIKGLREMMDGNERVGLLENCVRATYSAGNSEGNNVQRKLNEETKKEPSKIE